MKRLLASASGLGVPLDRDQGGRLLLYERLLVRRAAPLGLIGADEPERIRFRHVLDSLRAARTVRPADGTAYDLGSGAGLPGVVVAVARPELQVGLVDSGRKRAAFLELVLEELELSNARVLWSRVERLSEAVDVCFARALAPLERAWELAAPLLRPGGRLVHFSGRGPNTPGQLPLAASTEVAASDVLETAGPLTIITRQ